MKKITCAIVLTLAQSLTADTSRLYAVNVGSDLSVQEAAALESRLALQGFSPVWTHDDRTGTDVLLGRFETNGEAWAAAKSMSKFGFLSANVIAMEDSELWEAEFASPEPPLVARKPKYSLGGSSSFSSDARFSTFRESAARRDDLLTAAMGVRLIDELPDTDPAKAKIMVETAAATVRVQKKTGAVMPYLLKVAHGEVVCTEDVLIESRLMLADSWHYYWFAPLKAYRGYKEILSAHGDEHPEIAVRCRVEMAACLLELARMPKAEWRAEYSDVRRECDRILNGVPRSFTRAHAVADLMKCETYVFEARDERWEGNPEKVSELIRQGIDAFEGFEERHVGRLREISMANHMRAWLYGMAGDWERSKVFIDANLKLDFSDPREGFYWAGEQWDVRKLSLERGVFFSAKFGDKAANQGYQNLLNSHTGLVRFSSPNEQKDATHSICTAFPHAFYSEEVSE